MNEEFQSGCSLLTTREVAALFRVGRHTVSLWANNGRLGSIRTPGGHHRFYESEVRALLHRESDTDGGDRP